MDSEVKFVWKAKKNGLQISINLAHLYVNVFKVAASLLSFVPKYCVTSLFLKFLFVVPKHTVINSTNSALLNTFSHPNATDLSSSSQSLQGFKPRDLFRSH
jgi:hypothetical protein